MSAGHLKEKHDRRYGILGVLQAARREEVQQPQVPAILRCNARPESRAVELCDVLQEDLHTLA